MRFDALFAEILAHASLSRPAQYGFHLLSDAGKQAFAAACAGRRCVKIRQSTRTGAIGLHQFKTTEAFRLAG